MELISQHSRVFSRVFVYVLELVTAQKKTC